MNPIDKMRSMANLTLAKISLNDATEAINQIEEVINPDENKNGCHYCRRSKDDDRLLICNGFVVKYCPRCGRKVK